MWYFKRCWLLLTLAIFSSVIVRGQSIPVLTGFSKSVTGSISSTGVASFSVSYTPGSSAVNFISINVSPPSGAAKSFDSATGSALTSPTTVSATVTAAWLDGSYTINYVIFTDTSGRIVYYYRDGRILVIPSLTGAPSTHLLQFSNVDFSVSGVQGVAPSITTQPSSTSVTAGNYVLLSTMVAGSSPISYQWRKDGVNISGATSSTYAINSATTVDAGNYTVLVTNAVGSVTSNVATVTVIPAVMPSFSRQPTTANSTLTVGGSLYLNCMASGSAPITYQWKKNGVAIPGATTENYNINSVVLADAGSYTVTVTNAAGSITSNAVVVTVNPPIAPSFYMQPSSASLAVGATLSLNANVVGSTPMTYQWSKNGIAIVGATSSFYSINSVVLTDAGAYTVTATNAAGNATSIAAVIAVTAAVPPVIVTQPVSSISIPVGQTLNISVSVTGSSPISYTWKKDGVFRGYPGDILPSLNIQSVQLSDAGSYTVELKNAAGSVVSSPTIVKVTPAGSPYFYFMYTDRVQTVYSGNKDTVSFMAPSGSGNTYQILKDGVKVADVSGGSGNINYVINSAAATDAGEYTLLATNSFGSAISPKIILKVLDSPPVLKQYWSGSNAGANSYDTGYTISLIEGADLRLNFSFEGSYPIIYSWHKKGVTLSDTPKFTDNYNIYKSNPTVDGNPDKYTQYSTSRVFLADAGEYYVIAKNAFGSLTTSKVTVNVTRGSVSGVHSIAEGGYVASSIMKITNTVTHDGTISSLGWKATVPVGWTYQGGAGSEGDIKPNINATSTLEWAWTKLPASPFTFTYFLKIPSNLPTLSFGTDVTIASQMVWQKNGTAGQVYAWPYALVLNTSNVVYVYHSADTDKNYVISLQELLRVIELYSYTSGGVRTGQYSDGLVAADGYLASPGKLSSYHSADTNKDGKISLSELLRVIELYNYRVNINASRSGQYRMSAGTEDGFAPGP